MNHKFTLGDAGEWALSRATVPAAHYEQEGAARAPTSMAITQPLVPQAAGASRRWLTPAEELPLFEALRLGDVRAFAALAAAVDPVLDRLLLLHVPDVVARRRVVERSWACALSSVDMFRWQTPLTTWIAGIAVEHGRAHLNREPVRRAPSPPVRVLPCPAGPDDWSDLPWGPRWSGAQRAVEAAVARLQLDGREVLHTRRVEGWSARRACDVLGLTEVAHGRLLADAEAHVRAALDLLVVGSGDERHRDAQLAAVRAFLAALAAPAHEHPPATAAFRAWRLSQLSGWRRLAASLPRRSRALTA